MARDADYAAAASLFCLFALLSKFSRTPWWQPSHTDKGGRGAGPGATTTPVPQGGTTMWSEPTMRMFAEQMYQAGIDARLVLLGIAAASNFNADEYLGNNTGLLLVRRDHLSEVGYPGVPTFEELDAVHQIPWIAKVLAYRMAHTGGSAPDNVGDLAVLLNPIANPNITEMIRNEANKRATAAVGTMLYISHDNLLQHVLANP